MNKFSSELDHFYHKQSDFPLSLVPQSDRAPHSAFTICALSLFCHHFVSFPHTFIINLHNSRFDPLRVHLSPPASSFIMSSTPAMRRLNGLTGNVFSDPSLQTVPTVLAQACAATEQKEASQTKGFDHFSHVKEGQTTCTRCEITSDTNDMFITTIKLRDTHCFVRI